MTALRVEVMNSLEQLPDNQLEKVFDFIKNILDKNEDDEDLKKISSGI